MGHARACACAPGFDHSNIKTATCAHLIPSFNEQQLVFGLLPALKDEYDKVEDAYQKIIHDAQEQNKFDQIKSKCLFAARKSIDALIFCIAMAIRCLFVL